METTVKILDSNGNLIEQSTEANPRAARAAARKAVMGTNRIALSGGWIYRFDARQNKIRRVMA